MFFLKVFKYFVNILYFFFGHLVKKLLYRFRIDTGYEEKDYERGDLYVNELLENVLEDQGCKYDPFIMEDCFVNVPENFLVKENGTIGFYKSCIKGLKTLSRNGICSLMVNKNQMHIIANLGASSLYFYSKLAAKFTSFKQEIVLQGTLTDVKILLDFGINSDTGRNGVLHGFIIHQVKGMKLRISGLGIFTGPLNVFLNFTIFFLKPIIRNCIECIVESYITERLPKYQFPIEGINISILSAETLNTSISDLESPTRKLTVITEESDGGVETCTSKTPFLVANSFNLIEMPTKKEEGSKMANETQSLQDKNTKALNSEINNSLPVMSAENVIHIKGTVKNISLEDQNGRKLQEHPKECSNGHNESLYQNEYRKRKNLDCNEGLEFADFVTLLRKFPKYENDKMQYATESNSTDSGDKKEILKENHEYFNTDKGIKTTTGTWEMSSVKGNALLETKPTKYTSEKMNNLQSQNKTSTIHSNQSHEKNEIRNNSEMTIGVSSPIETDTKKSEENSSVQRKASIPTGHDLESKDSNLDRGVPELEDLPTELEVTHLAPAAPEHEPVTHLAPAAPELDDGYGNEVLVNYPLDKQCDNASE